MPAELAAFLPNDTSTTTDDNTQTNSRPTPIRTKDIQQIARELAQTEKHIILCTERKKLAKEGLEKAKVDYDNRIKELSERITTATQDLKNFTAKEAQLRQQLQQATNSLPTFRHRSPIEI